MPAGFTGPHHRRDVAAQATTASVASTTVPVISAVAMVRENPGAARAAKIGGISEALRLFMNRMSFLNVPLVAEGSLPPCYIVGPGRSTVSFR